MSKIYITVYSKNKIILQNFLIFLQKRLPILKLQLVSKYNNNKKFRKKITILKSPHINKTAQEQYEYRIYSYTIKTYSFRIKKYVLFLKKLKNNLFPDIKIKIKTVIEKNKTFNIKTNCFKINNYKLNFNRIKNIQKCNFKKSKKTHYINSETYLSLVQKTLNYLKIADCNGEFDINTKKIIITRY